MSMDSSPVPRRGSASKGPRRSILILPKMEHNLEDWLNFPTEPTHYAFFNSITLPFKWLLWTSKGLASLSPNEEMRSRLSSQSSLLGNVAALYLVVAISAFLSPPVSNMESDQVLISIYGVLMFFSAISLTFYICLSMTVMYPLLESMPDFAATEAYENLALRWGGYEMFLFNGGCQSVLFGLLIGAKIIYSNRVVYCMVALFIFLYWYSFLLYFAIFYYGVISVGAKLTREFFIAIDPITSLHMGICKCQETIDRAKRLSDVIRKRLHDYLSKNEDNRKEYRDAHYSEMEPLDESTLLPLVMEDYTSGSITPVNSHANESTRSVGGGGVTFTFPSEPQPKRDSIASVESEMHVSTKRPMFGGGNGSNTTAAPTSRPEPVRQVSCDVGVDSAEFAEEDDVSVPTLEEIFLGTKPLLLYGPQKLGEDSIISFGVGRKDVERNHLMSLDECAAVLQVLIKQGCFTTESLVMLLKWHTYNSCTLKSGNNGGIAQCSYGKVELNECVKVCVQLGIPMFHAVIVVDYLKPYL